MLTSFIIYIETEDYKGQINRILKRIKKLHYPKKQIEILIYARAANALRVYKIIGPPLIRILPSIILDTMIKDCLGDKIFVINEWFKFPYDFLSKKRILPAYVGNMYYEVCTHFGYPVDTKCFRTASIMKMILLKRKICGRWGRLNRKEIMRYIYRWDEISRINKVRLIWGYLWGK